jgi:hypothetical protein
MMIEERENAAEQQPRRHSPRRERQADEHTERDGHTHSAQESPLKGRALAVRERTCPGIVSYLIHI